MKRPHRSFAPEDEAEAEAARWVARSDAGLTPAEGEELARWKAANPRRAQALVRFETAWKVLSRPRRTGEAGALDQRWRALERRQQRRRLSLAAVAATAIMAIGLLGWPRGRHPALALDSAGQTKVLLPERRVLPDGTVVELRDGAELTVAFTASLRRVILPRGTAFFEVTKNRTRPFVVDAAGVEVQAVGTAFSVQLDRATVEVLVTEGRVAVAQPDHSRIAPAGVPVALVDAGSRATLEISPKKGGVVPQIHAVSDLERDVQLAWVHPRAEFSDAPLSQVIEVVNRYSRRRLVLGDPTLAGTALTGLFRADDTEALTSMLDKGFGIRAEDGGDGSIILRRSR